MSAQEIRFWCESDGVGKRTTLVKKCLDEKEEAHRRSIYMTACIAKELRENWRLRSSKPFWMILL